MDFVKTTTLDNASGATIRRLLQREGKTLSWLAQKSGLPLGLIWAVAQGLDPRPDVRKTIAKLLDTYVDAIWPPDTAAERASMAQRQTGTIESKPIPAFTAEEWRQVNGLSPAKDKDAIIRKIGEFHDQMEEWTAEQPLTVEGDLENNRYFLLVATMPDGKEYGLIRISGRYTLPTGESFTAITDAIKAYEESGAIIVKYPREARIGELREKAKRIAKHHKQQAEERKEAEKINKVRIEYEQEFQAWRDLRTAIDQEIAQLREDFALELDGLRSDIGQALMSSADMTEQPVVLNDGKTAWTKFRNTSWHKLVTRVDDTDFHWLVPIGTKRTILGPNGEVYATIEDMAKSLTEEGWSIFKTPVLNINAETLKSIAESGEFAISEHALNLREDLPKPPRKPKALEALAQAGSDDPSEEAGSADAQKEEGGS